MTTNALVFLIFVWGVIIAATLHCFYKLMTSDRSFESHDE
jgi:hypothetical protein